MPLWNDSRPLPEQSTRYHRETSVPWRGACHGKVKTLLDLGTSMFKGNLSFAKTPQGLDSGSRNNVTGHSHAYSFQPRFEILTRNRQEGAAMLLVSKTARILANHRTSTEHIWPNLKSIFLNSEQDTLSRAQSGRGGSTTRPYQPHWLQEAEVGLRHFRADTFVQYNVRRDFARGESI